METPVIEYTTTVKKQIEDILLDLSWARISRNYFGKSTGWLYHKLNGIDSHGNRKDFSEHEKEQLKRALYDMAAKISAAAENIR
jgi:hypothetical protein